MRQEVTLLLCAGIDHGTWASLQGHGIKVIPHAMGEALAMLDAWRRGSLKPPDVWPTYPPGANAFAQPGCGAGRRRRFRGGRN